MKEITKEKEEEEINENDPSVVRLLKITSRAVFNFSKEKVIISQINRTLIFEEVKTHRFNGCDHYSECCDYAVKENWKSFSCFSCPVFKLF